MLNEQFLISPPVTVNPTKSALNSTSLLEPLPTHTSQVSAGRKWQNLVDLPRCQLFSALEPLPSYQLRTAEAAWGCLELSEPCKRVLVKASARFSTTKVILTPWRASQSPCHQRLRSNFWIQESQLFRVHPHIPVSGTKVPLLPPRLDAIYIMQNYICALFGSISPLAVRNLIL